MEIEFDADKREKTLAERGLDFAQAGEVFAGKHFTGPDIRRDCVELRFITVGLMGARMVVRVWTPRGSPHYQHEQSQ